MATRKDFEALMEQRIREGDYVKANKIRTEKLGLPPISPEIKPTNDPQFQVDSGFREAGNVLAGLPGNLYAGLSEGANAFNRSAMAGLDFLGPGTINAGLRLADSETQLPTFLGGYDQTFDNQTFMADGFAKDLMRGYWGAMPAAGSMAPVAGRNVATPAGAALDLIGLGTSKPAPNVAPLTFGAEGAVATPTPQATSIGDMIGPTATRAKIDDLASEGSESAERAGFGYDPYSGRATRNAMGEEAMRQGLDPAFESMVETSTPATRAKLSSMLDILEQGKNFMRDSIRYPSDVVGDSLLQRIEAVEAVRKDAGKKLNVAAKALKDMEIDVSPAVSDFMDELDDMGIKIDPSKFVDDLKLGDDVVSFKGADIEGMAGEEAQFKRLLKRLLSDNLRPFSAYDAHRLKKFLDYNINYGKRLEGTSGNTQRLFEGLRHHIDEILDQTSPAYREANDQYREAVRPLKAIKTYAGKHADLGGQGADADLGTLVRRITSRARSRIPIMNAMQELDTVAKKYQGRRPGQEVGEHTGGALAREAPNFDDDMVTQAMFANELERMFGAAANTSFMGDIQKVAQGAAVDAMLPGAGPTLWSTVGAGLHSGMDYLRGINEENNIRALRNLLGR